MLSLITASLLLVVFINGNLTAQTVKYTYDQAGNRTSRLIVLGSQSNVNKNPIDTVQISPDFAGSSIKIYPNPTLGELKVNIAGAEIKNECILQVYSANGMLLINQNAQSGENSLNMNEYLPGWYILRLIIEKTIKNLKS